MLQEFAGGERLRGSNRKIQQKFLKRIVLTTRRVCGDSLFRSFPQTSPLRHNGPLGFAQVIELIGLYPAISI
jgi:hypothetical protein